MINFEDYNFFRMVNMCMVFIWLLASFAVYALGLKMVADLSVDEGSSVILNCTCKSNEKVTWLGPNKNASLYEKDESDTIPYTTGSRLNPQLNKTNIILMRENFTEECILKITNFSKVDEGTYICQNLKLEAHVFKVFVKRKPKNLTVTTSSEYQSMTVVEGMHSSLWCRVHSGRPKEKLKLVVNDTITENGSGEVIHNFTPRKTDHNVSVLCEASSNIMRVHLVKKTRLNVHFKPTTYCTLEPQQLIEGKSAKLCCAVKSNPPSNITWIMAENKCHRLDTPDRNCLVWSHINRTQNGCYTYIAENYLGAANSTIKVQVFYPPQVIVAYNLDNGTLNLECNPLGAPNNYTFLQLEHRSEFNEHVRFMDASNDGYVLHKSIEDAGLQDTGIYVCNVSNGILDKNERKFQSGKILVKSKGAPVHLGGDIIKYAKIGEDIIFSTVIYNGHGKHINATIQSKRKIIHNLKINSSFVMVRKLFHGSNITLNASQVSVPLDLMTTKYFTKYIIKICNKYGCTDIKINIKINTSKNQGSTRGKYQDVEIVIAALAVLSTLAIGMAVAYLIWKKANNKDKNTLSQTEDSGEETQGQSVENRLYQSREIMNSDNPAHVLQVQAMRGYVYDASSSQVESTRNDQNYLSGSHLNYSEVVFEAGHSSSSNIIHGANDKTIYSEIDLAQSTSFSNDGSDTSSDDDFIYIDTILNIERKNKIE